MKFKKIAFIVLAITLLVEGGIFLNMTVLSSAANREKNAMTAKKISSVISSDGVVTAQNQATLHFQTAGKLIALPLKAGDKVSVGQTIAELDTYTLQKSLQLAANAYQISKNSTDQTNEYKQTGVLEGQQRLSLDTSNKNSYQNSTEVQVIENNVKRIVDNSLLAQNSAQIGVDLANYAVDLATLTSPLNGIVTHEDVDVSGVNITTTTSFVVADPTSVVFRANISENDIDYVSEGAKAEIATSGKRMQGTVVKIYPSKVTLANGQSVYQVDIQSDGLKGIQLDQSGTAFIMSNARNNVTLVPMWTVLHGKYIWVNDNGETVLKEVTVGRVHGTDIEILGGLKDSDKVITDPESISKKKYLLL